jgi:hypothetical protein
MQIANFGILLFCVIYPRELRLYCLRFVVFCANMQRRGLQYRINEIVSAELRRSAVLPSHCRGMDCRTPMPIRYGARQGSCWGRLLKKRRFLKNRSFVYRVYGLPAVFVGLYCAFAYAFGRGKCLAVRVAGIRFRRVKTALPGPCFLNAGV